MKDKFEKEIQVTDIVLYTTYESTWHLGMVAKVRPSSIIIFEGDFTYHRNGNSSTSSLSSNKRSSTQLMVLEGAQLDYVIHNSSPFQRIKEKKDYVDFMKEFTKYRKTL